MRGVDFLNRLLERDQMITPGGLERGNIKIEFSIFQCALLCLLGSFIIKIKRSCQSYKPNKKAPCVRSAARGRVSSKELRC
jgi:hypothetical protein